MNTLSHGLSWIDLQFLGRSHVIAAGVVQGPAGVAIIDPGPTSCLTTLELGLQEHGIRWDDVRQILLTHVHLDHAGATGTIVRAAPPEALSRARSERLSNDVSLCPSASSFASANSRQNARDARWS